MLRLPCASNTQASLSPLLEAIRSDGNGELITCSSVKPSPLTCGDAITITTRGSRPHANRLKAFISPPSGPLKIFWLWLIRSEDRGCQARRVSIQPESPQRAMPRIEANRMIVSAGDEPITFRGEGYGVDRRGVQADARDQLLTANIPQGNQLVITCRNDLLSVRREIDRLDARGVSTDHSRRAQWMRFPQLHSAAVLAGDQLFAIRRKVHADELSRTEICFLDCLPRPSVVQYFKAPRVSDCQHRTVLGTSQSVHRTGAEPGSAFQISHQTSGGAFIDAVRSRHQTAIGRKRQTVGDDLSVRVPEP